MPTTLQVQGRNQQRSQAGQYRKEGRFRIRPSISFVKDNPQFTSSPNHKFTIHKLFVNVLKDSGINVPLTNALELTVGWANKDLMPF